MPNFIMEDGFPTRVRFLGNTAAPTGSTGSLVAYSELPEEFTAKTVTPPGYDLGGENKISSMENETYHTKASKRLIDLTTINMEGHYSPELYTDFLSMLGKNQIIELNFAPEGVGDGPEAPTASVGRVLTFWGFIDKFTPGTHEEGSPPTATIEIVITNRNLDGDETAPTLAARPA